MAAQKIMRATPYLRWCLEKGLKITRIYQAVEFKRGTPFKSFVNNVADRRRQADQDPSTAPNATKAKLEGNSGYGSLIMNKDGHRTLRYVDEDNLLTKHADKHFVRSICITDPDPLELENALNNDNEELQDNVRTTSPSSSLEEDPWYNSLASPPTQEEIHTGEQQQNNNEKQTYEVVMHKKSQKHTVPHYLGLFVLDYAKMRMLQFYYDCLATYIDPRDRELGQMDTDSIYFGVSNKVTEVDVNNLDCHPLLDIITPEKRRDFQDQIWNHCNDHWLPDFDQHFFPRQCCQRHNQYDQRTPGLFKLEFCGRTLTALCSKSYSLVNAAGDQHKFASKGVNKDKVLAKANEHHAGHVTNMLRDALLGSQVIQVSNVGFRTREAYMTTYKQNKTAFNPFYIKRTVQADGIHTKPLDKVLTVSKYKQFKGTVKIPFDIVQRFQDHRNHPQNNNNNDTIVDRGGAREMLEEYGLDGGVRGEREYEDLDNGDGFIL